MNEDIAHADRLCPDFIGMTLPELRRKTADRFTHDLKVPQNPGLDSLVPLERRASLRGVLPDGFGGLDNVP